MDPAPTTVPSAAPADPRPAEPRTLARLTLGAASLALVGFLVAVVLLAVPVRTPAVQDCGAPGAYLFDGRLDVVPDAEGRIRDADGEVVTLAPAVAEAARARPCQERVADRAVPAGVLAAAATVLGLAAFAVELLVVRPRLRRARTAPGPTRDGAADAPHLPA